MPAMPSRSARYCPPAPVRFAPSQSVSRTHYELPCPRQLRSIFRSMTLEEILRRPESKTLEFKRDLSSPRPALCTLVAFANSAGGRLVLGVDDEDKRVVGIEHPLDLERHIANLIADSIQPTLLPEIEIVPWRRIHVLV